MKRYSYRAWLSKEVDKLHFMRLSGKTIRECAAALGRSHQSVRVQSQRMKLKRLKRWWHVMLLEEHNLRDVAHVAGVSYATVKREKARMNRCGLKCPPSTKRCEDEFSSRADELL